MRYFKTEDTFVGSIDIAKIEFDLKSRDEIPKVLIGLQYVYCDEKIREEIFGKLHEVIPATVSVSNGRPGMDLWKILVLAILRLNCNWDYDKLKEMADNHLSLRLMLGHGRMDDTRYPLQTIKDNVKLFSPSVLKELNTIIVKSGNDLIKKKDEKLRGSCDSFVVESNIHFPTDLNLLYDAVRKLVSFIALVFAKLSHTIWRQKKYNIKKLKKLIRKLQNMKRSTSQNEEKKAKRITEIKSACREILDYANELIYKALSCIESLKENIEVAGFQKELNSAEAFSIDAIRQVDQIKRRVILGEVIPHNQKVFSIYESYVEWIVKGKAGTPQELGLMVCIFKDQFGFLLNHEIMKKKVDKDIAVPFTEETQKLFPDLVSGSFDKGFWSPENYTGLTKILNFVILSKKGRLSKEDKERQNNQDFKNAKRKHSAVEASISALENHGLDKCNDRGELSFERYVAFAVIGRNTQILGDLIQKRMIQKIKRSAVMKEAKLKNAA